jgi:hypothetical protein
MRGAGGRGTAGAVHADLVDLLLRGLVGGIDLEGVLELVEGTVDVATLQVDAAAVDVGGGGLEAGVFVAGLVPEIIGGLDVSLLVVLVGDVVVLARLGGLAALVPGRGRLRVGSGGGDEDCAEKKERGESQKQRPNRSAGLCNGAGGVTREHLEVYLQPATHEADGVL